MKEYLKELWYSFCYILPGALAGMGLFFFSSSVNSYPVMWNLFFSMLLASAGGGAVVELIYSNPPEKQGEDDKWRFT